VTALVLRRDVKNIRQLKLVLELFIFSKVILIIKVHFAVSSAEKANFGAIPLKLHRFRFLAKD